MQSNRTEKSIEHEFHVSWYIIFYKLLFGLMESLSGLSIALFGNQMMRIFTLDAAKELSEDPHDLLARISEQIIPHLFRHNSYIILYLIILGTAKIAGAIGLLYKQNWGVDLLVGLTMVLFPFQLFHLFMRPSLFDFLNIAIGVFIALYLIEFKPKAWISKIFRQ